MTQSATSTQGTTASNHGVVTSVRGSVVDVRFDHSLPPIYSLMRTGKDGRISIEVLMQLDARHVRGIALNPTEGLARGMAVEDTGGPLKVPVGKSIIARMFDVFGNPIDRQPPPSDVVWRTRSIGIRPHWPVVPPSLKFLKRASRSLTCWCRWSAAARRDCSGARVSARRCCSPR